MHPLMYVCLLPRPRRVLQYTIATPRISVGTLLLAFEHSEWMLDVWRVVGGYMLIATGVLYFMLVSCDVSVLSRSICMSFIMYLHTCAQLLDRRSCYTAVALYFFFGLCVCVCVFFFYFHASICFQLVLVGPSQLCRRVSLFR